MGVIGAILGGPGVQAIGETVRDVAEVFTPNATRRMELSAEAQVEALKQLTAESQRAPVGWFGQAVDGLNRLPRPALAFGVLGLFSYAMVDPAGFSLRMVGLSAVPEPLWWLLGAVVSFYFGAREAFYFRNRPPAPLAVVTGAAPQGGPEALPAAAAELPGMEAAETVVPGGFPANPALEEWRLSRG